MALRTVAVRTVVVRTVVVRTVVVHTVVVVVVVEAVVVDMVVVGIAVPKAFYPISRTAPVDTILSASTVVSSGGDVCVFKEIIRDTKGTSSFSKL